MSQIRKPPKAEAADSRDAGGGQARGRGGDSGASVYRTQVSDRWRSYLAHHRHSARDSLQRLLATPLQSLMTWLVIAVALALPAAMKTALDNVQVLGDSWQGVPQLSVFLNPRARPAAIDTFREQLQKHPQVKGVEYISPEQALKEFEARSGMGNALSSLDSNPLPPTLLVVPNDGLDAQALAALGDKLKAEPVVDDVVFDRAWVERLNQLLALGERLVLALGGLLGLGVVLVIGNTIRLSIENRRDEIVVIKLVGGTDAFVRRPFLYTGIWYGLGGGLIALVLQVLLLWLLSGPVAALANSYQSHFGLSGLGLSGSLNLLLLAALIGWLGAWLAVGRHLGEIQPR